MESEIKTSFKKQRREFRCLLKDAMRCNHSISKDAIYSRAADIMRKYFHNQSLTDTSMDVLTWPRNGTNKMEYHPTPNLKGI